MNNNIAWINGLKAFGITAVILGHIANPLNQFIFSWHMPLFFMMAGFFIKTELDFKSLITKDWKRLMIPYFIFSALAIVVESLKRWGLHREPLDYINEFKAIFIWMDMEHLINSYAFVLWFLPALFCAKMFYYIVIKNVSNRLLQCSIFILLFWMSFNVQLPFSLSSGMNSALWVFIGSLLFDIANDGFKFRTRTFSFESILFFPVVGIMGIYAYSGIPGLDMASLNYENTIINVVWAVSLALIFIYSFNMLTYRGFTCRFFDSWGRSTMMLFILHPYTSNISHLVVEKIHFGGWPLKLMISMILLHLALLMKQRFSNRWIFKYV